MNKSLVTSELMNSGAVAQVFAGGSCNSRAKGGTLVRTEGRDPLWVALEELGITFFDPQIDLKTHGREYDWEKDGLTEKKARTGARIRVYEVGDKSLSAVTMLEIMQDAALGRKSIVWFSAGKKFSTPSMGTRAEIRGNAMAKSLVSAELLADIEDYAKAGDSIRAEITEMVASIPQAQITFAESLDEVILQIRLEFADIIRERNLHTIRFNAAVPTQE